MVGSSGTTDFTVPVINLSEAPGERRAWDRPKFVIYLWAIVELLFVTNAWQISSGLRVTVLRSFGAKIGSDVVFRPRTRVKFPWKLKVGDRSWIGEGVWIHNQDQVSIGNDVVVSQESFLTTGSHAHREDMRLLTAPLSIEDGAWITSRAMITGGINIGRSALIGPMTLVQVSVPENLIFTGNPGRITGVRFPVKGKVNEYTDVNKSPED